MKLKDINSERCNLHTYVLNEDKYIISNFVKSVILPKSLADLLKFIKARKIKINDIGGWIMSKNPFVINFDFSESALNQDCGFIYVMGSITQSDLLKIKLQIIDMLKIKFKRLREDKEKITTDDDENIFNNLVDEVFNCKIELVDIKQSELENNQTMCKLWCSYLTYLLTKEEMELEVSYSMTLKLGTILKNIKSKGVLDDFSDKNISEIPKEYIKIASPKECEDIVIKESNKKADSQCTYKIRECIKLNFKLRNNGSSVEALSNSIYVDDKPFSFVLSIGMDDALTEELTIKLFISSTSWVNEKFDCESQLKLKTTDKVSLYICPNASSNYYTRLEILNKSDDSNFYNKFLSKLDASVLSKMTNGEVSLSDILNNTSKFLDFSRLDEGQPFIGIPVSAQIKSEAKNSQLSGVPIKDKECFYEYVYDILSKNISITKSECIPIVKDSVVDTFESKYNLVDVDKIDVNNEKLKQINICYWTDTNENFNRFKEFLENIKTKHSKNSPEADVFKKKCKDNTYDFYINDRNILVNLLKMNSLELTSLLESKNKYPNKNDKRIRISKNKKIIENEFLKYNDLNFENTNECYTINILEIDEYHNRYNLSKYDPSDTIKQAFLELNHSVQRINAVTSINRRINEAQANGKLKDVEKLKSMLSVDKIGNIYKSALLDTFSKKGFTVKINDEELSNNEKEVYGFMTEVIGSNKVYLMSKINSNGYFIKDISKVKSNMQRRSRENSNNVRDNDGWIEFNKFPELCKKYTGRINTEVIEENELWSIIENNIDNSNPNDKKILFISSSERKHMESLRNSNISDDIKILRNIKNLAIVRVNEMNKEVPYAIIYKYKTDEGWVASNNQGLCRKTEKLYYDIGQRGSTLQVALGTSKLMKQSKPIARRKAIEFYIVSNNENLYEESAVLASGLRKVNIAFEVSTNLPMPLFMLKNISSELSFVQNYENDDSEDSCIKDEIEEVISLDDNFYKIEEYIQQSFFEMIL